MMLAGTTRPLRELRMQWARMAPNSSLASYHKITLALMAQHRDDAFWSFLQAYAYVMRDIDAYVSRDPQP